MKRKYNKKDDYDYNDPFICDDISPKKSSKLELIKQEIYEREITIEKILKINMEMDDYIWFVEHLNVINDLHPEDKLKLKNIIYKKYKQIQNINMLDIDMKQDNIDILTKIIKSNHSKEVKEILYKKYKKMNEYSNMNNTDEIVKMNELIDTALNIPTYITKFNVNSLSNIWEYLNKNMYGMINVKEKIMETICSQQNGSNGKVITLVGAPGVGKTAIGKHIAMALDRPYDQISFGSLKDSTILTGHSSTYIGAVPSLFTKILIKSKSLDMVILLDEIDKIPDTPEGKSISAVLLHILDPTQNNKFKDMYIPEIPLDLSKILFIIAVNSIDNIDKILLDRMNIIHLQNYSLEDKIEIVENYLLPILINKYNIKIKISKKSILYLINKTIYSYGMRNIQRSLEQIFERIILIKNTKNTNIKLSYNIPNLIFPLLITDNIIDILL
jgi:ATP-dependent Lon protease